MKQKNSLYFFLVLQILIAFATGVFGNKIAELFKLSVFSTVVITIALLISSAVIAIIIYRYQNIESEETVSSLNQNLNQPNKIKSKTPLSAPRQDGLPLFYIISFALYFSIYSYLIAIKNLEIAFVFILCWFVLGVPLAILIAKLDYKINVGNRTLDDWFEDIGMGGTFVCLLVVSILGIIFILPSEDSGLESLFRVIFVIVSSIVGGIWGYFSSKLY